MPLATRNNALIVKDGKVADGCGCCGGWYCLRCACSGTVPPALKTRVTFTCLSSTASFDLRMVAWSFAEDDCAVYAAVWGNTSSPLLDARYDSTVTGNQISLPPFFIPETLSGALWLQFTPQCKSYTGYIGPPGTSAQQVYTTQLQNAVIVTGSTTVSPMWRFGANYGATGSLSPGVYRQFSGQETPRQWIVPTFTSATATCYRDFSVSSIPLSFQTFNGQEQGTLSIEVVGVE